MKLAVAIILAVVAVFFVGLASASTTQVLIKGYNFQPDTVTIQRGDTVTWMHPGTLDHIVKFPDAESQILKNGGTYSKTFDQAGTFDYICGVHPSMHGKVVVQ